MRTLVLGDVHGGYAALIQCLERCSFDYYNDVLIQLGDVVDGYPQTYECVEELLKIRNLIPIKGNHDEWLNQFIATDFHPFYWTYGGKGTLISYLAHAGKKEVFVRTSKGFKSSLDASDIPLAHQSFFANQKLYHVDGKNRCFLHAGFNRAISFYGQQCEEYYNNRSLWQDSFSFIARRPKDREHIVAEFAEVFIGHTPTTSFGSDQPLQASNILNVDTGAGHGGKLTIMDIDTKEFWQSEPLSELYSVTFRV